MPYWAPFRRGIAEQLGRHLCWTVSHVAAYFAETVQRTPAGGHWVIGDVKNQEGYRQPLFESGATGLRIPTEDHIAVMLRRGLARADIHGERDAQPEALRRKFDRFMGVREDSPLDASESLRLVNPAIEPEPPFSVHSEQDGSFHVVYSLEDVADETSDQLDRLIDVIARGRAVEKVWREDREVIIVIAPQLAQARSRS